MTQIGEPVDIAGERLLPEQKLLRRVDYQRCYKSGKRRYGSLVTLHFIGNELEHPRLGITASRKVGNSVVRHLLRRRVREVYRRWPRRGSLPAVDLVVHLKPSARGARFAPLREELLRLLAAVGSRSRNTPVGVRQ